MAGQKSVSTETLIRKVTGVGQKPRLFARLLPPRRELEAVVRKAAECGLTSKDLVVLTGFSRITVFRLGGVARENRRGCAEEPTRS